MNLSLTQCHRCVNMINHTEKKLSINHKKKERNTFDYIICFSAGVTLLVNTISALSLLSLVVLFFPLRAEKDHLVQ